MATTSFFVTTPDYNFVLFVRYKVYKRSLLSSQLCGRFVGKGEFWLMKIVETKWEKKTCHKDVLPLFLSFFRHFVSAVFPALWLGSELLDSILLIFIDPAV